MKRITNVTIMLHLFCIYSRRRDKVLLKCHSIRYRVVANMISATITIISHQFVNLRPYHICCGICPMASNHCIRTLQTNIGERYSVDLPLSDSLSGAEWKEPYFYLHHCPSNINAACTNSWLILGQSIWWLFRAVSWLNILRSKQNGKHFGDDNFKYSFANESLCICIDISLNLIYMRPIDNESTLV